MHTYAQRLLNGATATGDGPVYDLSFPALALAIQAEITGAPATCVLNLMALLDGGTWDTLAVLDVTQGYISGEIEFIQLPAPVRQVKGNVGSLSSGLVSLYLTARG